MSFATLPIQYAEDVAYVKRTLPPDPKSGKERGGVVVYLLMMTN